MEPYKIEYDSFWAKWIGHHIRWLVRRNSQKPIEINGTFECKLVSFSATGFQPKPTVRAIELQATTSYATFKINI